MGAVFLQGNALSVLRGLPGDFFHCCVTSPPFFGLRRYEGGEVDWGDYVCQLGAEPTPSCSQPYMTLRSDWTGKEREYVTKRLQEEGLL